MAAQNLNEGQFVTSIGIPDSGPLTPIDSDAPDLTIHVPETNNVQRTYICTIRWNQEVGGVGPDAAFQATDVGVSGAVSSNFYGEGDLYTLNITLPQNRNAGVVITIDANVAKNERGVSGPPVQRTFSFSYDTRQVETPTNKTCSRTFNYIDSRFPYLPTGSTASGGSFEPPLECLYHNGFVYMVLQIGEYKQVLDNSNRADPQYTATSLTEDTQASAVLVRLQISDCTWNLLKTYPNVSTAAHSLCVHNNMVHFFEGSHYAYYNEGIFTEIADPNQEDLLSLGTMERIDTQFSAGVIGTSVDRQWRLGTNTIIFRFDRQDAEYAQIKRGFQVNRLFIISNARLFITRVSLNESSQVNGIITVEFINVDNRTLPAVGEEPEIAVNISDYTQVFSTRRLRDLLNTDNWKNEVGSLYRIENNNTITHLGRNWVSGTLEDNPNRDIPKPFYEEDSIDLLYGIHGGTTAPMISEGSRLHLITGYSKIDNIDNNESEAARLDNWQWIQYGENLNTKIAAAHTNNRTFLNYIEDLAVLTNSVFGIGIDNDESSFFFRPRSPIQAELSQDIPNSFQSNIFNIENITRNSFPSTGTGSIGKEIIKWNGSTASSITNVSRAQENTERQEHKKGAVVTKIDHIISLNSTTLQMPIETINVEENRDYLFNSVVLFYGQGREYRKENEASIKKYKETKELSRNLLLDETQTEWVEWLADEYLKRYADPIQVMNISLRLSLYLKLGDVVYLQSEREILNRAVQVVEIGHDLFNDETRVKFVSV